MHNYNHWIVKLSFVVSMTTGLNNSLAAPHPLDVPNKTPVIENFTTIRAFKEGVYHFLENHESFFKLGPRQGQNYRLNTHFSPQTPHQFSYGGKRDWIVENGRLRKPSNVTLLRTINNQKVIVQGRKQDALVIRLKAYDVADKSISSFLRTHNGRPSKISGKIPDGYRFSLGAIAYVPTFQTLSDKIIIPNKEVLIGPKNLESFVRTFSGKIPNCLNYERRSGSQPYAIRFLKRQALEGEIEIFKAKRSSVFCEVTGKRVALGQYRIKNINGTRLMILKFPNQIDSRDIGIKLSERDALHYAFVEIQSPKRQILPGLYVQRNKDFHDFQYRFNSIAADDIRKAMK